jgi:GntR family transcriptional regulator/MocR family aminotransferase
MSQGSDFLQLDAAGVPRGGRTAWLAWALREAIGTGVLGPGARMPATRALAEDLGFARGTVVEAYQRLTEEGLLAANRGAGTTVAASPVLREPAPRVAARTRSGAGALPGAGGTGGPAAAPFPEPGRRPGEGPGRTPGPGTTAPGPGPGGVAPGRSVPAEVTDLSTGLPDLAAFPRGAWLRAEREVLATATARQLGYAPPQGTPELRAELSAWLARSRGVDAPPERIVVSAGVTGALSLLAQVLRDRGVEEVALEDPGADGNRRILGYWMDRVTPVPVDGEGIDVAGLARTSATAVAVTPAHQFPTGVVLSPGRRRDLVAWAGERDGIVIEDDYDAEYRYDRSPVRAMHSLAPNAVAYTSSLSKTLAPALRLGWLVPPPRLLDAVVERRWATDLGSPVLPQLVLAALLRDGTLARHLRSMRTRHRARQRAAVAAVREYMPGCPVLGVAAGVHLLVMLPDGADDEEVAARALGEGVAVQPLSRNRSAPGAPGLVVSYAGHEPERLRDAVARLGRVV